MKETQQVSQNPSTEFVVGQKIRELRTNRNLSLKETAELSKLNINTLSLIENGKTSPTIGTLQQLAAALSVSISDFFESETVTQQVVFTSHASRPTSKFASTQMENLGKNLNLSSIQPFVVSLQNNAGSGTDLCVHSGHEFVYCLSGRIKYYVDQMEYLLEPDDSLVFEAHLPHRWVNVFEGTSSFLLVLVPASVKEIPGSQHFPK